MKMSVINKLKILNLNNDNTLPLIYDDKWRMMVLMTKWRYLKGKWRLKMKIRLTHRLRNTKTEKNEN